jgi:hypothetical protein
LARTSLVLVGMATSTDTNAYCNASSSCLVGGVLPAEIACGTYGLSAAKCVLEPLHADGGGTDGEPAPDAGGG